MIWWRAHVANEVFRDLLQNRRIIDFKSHVEPTAKRLFLVMSRFAWRAASVPLSPLPRREAPIRTGSAVGDSHGLSEAPPREGRGVSFRSSSGSRAKLTAIRPRIK
jgi:hypothetical protein